MYYSYYLKHYYYWLYCIYMPSDNEFEACVDRKKSYGTPLLNIYSEYIYNIYIYTYIYDKTKRII